MYVWMSILPTQATEIAHPDIHTRSHAVSEIVDFFHVCLLLPLQAEGMELHTQKHYMGKHTYRHPSIHTFVCRFGFSTHPQNFAPTIFATLPAAFWTRKVLSRLTEV